MVSKVEPQVPMEENPHKGDGVVALGAQTYWLPFEFPQGGEGLEPSPEGFLPRNHTCHENAELVIKLSSQALLRGPCLGDDSEPLGHKREKRSD